MGLFSYFRERRERESALSGAAGGQDLEAAVVAAQAQAQAQAQEQPGQVSGLEALGLLASVFGQAQTLKDSGVTVDRQVIDMRGTGLREEILGVLGAYGIDPNQQGQQINASEDMQRDIMAVLERNGLNLNAAQFWPPPSPPQQPEDFDPNVPQIRNPLDR